jgi:hypothetical protein
VAREGNPKGLAAERQEHISPASTHEMGKRWLLFEVVLR